MFSEKFKECIKNNYLLVLSFFFMYVAPLIMLVILACEGKTEKIKMELWGAVLGAILIVVYLGRFKKWVHDKKEFEKHEQLKVPVWLRLISLLITLIGFTVLFLILSTIKDMFDEIIIYSIACCVSVVIANLFLIADSKKRVAHKISRN